MKDLKKIPEKSPFKIPENYFEDINRKIIAETSGYESGTRVYGRFRKLRPYLAVAASLVLLMSLSILTIHFISSGRIKSGLPEITISEFSDNWLDDIDILTLEESAGSIDQSMVMSEVNSKDIIDWLLLQNVDIYDIN